MQHDPYLANTSHFPPTLDASASRHQPALALYLLFVAGGAVLVGIAMQYLCRKVRRPLPGRRAGYRVLDHDNAAEWCAAVRELTAKKKEYCEMLLSWGEEIGALEKACVRVCPQQYGTTQVLMNADGARSAQSWFDTSEARKSFREYLTVSPGVSIEMPRLASDRAQELLDILDYTAKLEQLADTCAQDYEAVRARLLAALPVTPAGSRC